MCGFYLRNICGMYYRTLTMKDVWHDRKSPIYIARQVRLFLQACKNTYVLQQSCSFNSHLHQFLFAYGLLRYEL